MKSTIYSTIIGLVLLLLYFLQYFIGLEWEWLAALQSQQMYKRWSGLAMALFILFQWLLTFSRVIPKFRMYAVKINTMHKWIGALSPILFYLHSAEIGYGYLALLSYIFFTNTLLGNLNLDFIRLTSEAWFKGWMIVHVCLSVIVVFLMVYHITIVFYYK